MHRVFFATLIAGLAIAGLARDTAAKGEPLADVLIASPRDCAAGDRLSVPIITWGADIVTIHAWRAGLFEEAGLDVTLTRQDAFLEQVRGYMRCDSPFLRATVGMAAQAVDVTEKSPQSALTALTQLSWSVGGDALVVRDRVARPADLCEETLAVQAYGPHVDYMYRVIADLCGGPPANIVWTDGLTGAGDTPAAVFAADERIGGAFVIIPDALTLTSGGGVGDGAEGSVRGAEILLSTRTANRVIADMYFARSDWVADNPGRAAAFVGALAKAEAEVREIVAEKGAAYRELFGEAAGILLDLPGEVEEAAALWADAEVAPAAAVARFFEPTRPRSFQRIMGEAQGFLQDAGLVARNHDIATFSADVPAPAAAAVGQPRFDASAAQEVANRLAAQGALEDGTLFAFEISFKPNAFEFPSAIYGAQFDRVVDLASTYGGALMIVEGHADPLNYLRKQQGGADARTLKAIAQSARSLSGQRAIAAKDGVVAHAAGRNAPVDDSQFQIIGAGLSAPKTGMCGPDPCAPSTEAEWLSNMRVVFRVVQVEAESAVFVPLD